MNTGQIDAISTSAVAHGDRHTLDSTYAVTLPCQSVHRPVDFVVVLYLVWRGVGSLLRSQPEVVAHFVWLEPDYWNRALYEHHGQRAESGATRFLEDATAISYAVLRLQLCCDGEGKGVCAD